MQTIDFNIPTESLKSSTYKRIKDRIPIIRRLLREWPIDLYRFFNSNNCKRYFLNKGVTMSSAVKPKSKLLKLDMRCYLTLRRSVKPISIISFKLKITIEGIYIIYI